MDMADEPKHAENTEAQEPLKASEKPEEAANENDPIATLEEQLAADDRAGGVSR
jgi:hypothetical protein